MAKQIELTTAAVDALNAKFPESTFSINPGRRFNKIVVERHGQRSVSFFIEEETGGVYKAAGWAKPANGVRFTAETPEEMTELIESRADVHGGWLYVR